MSDSECRKEIPKCNDRHPSLLPHARHSNASGFTLVELSIVLVIIGLLISGLLVGQSMIQAVKTQAFVRQIQQIDIAVSNFRTKYNHLPGDSPYHSAAGDGDGFIENSNTDNGVSATTLSHDEEVANFWVHLQQDGFLENTYGTFSADATSGLDVGLHMPKALGATDNAGIIIALDHAFNKVRNEYFICDFSQTTNEVNIYVGAPPVLAPAQALAIDVKMDDGLSGRGANPDIYSYNGIVWSWRTTTLPAGSCYASDSSNTYNSSNNLECCLNVRMLSQTEGGQ